MSRSIRPTSKMTLPDEEHSLRDTGSGKLLLTCYQKKQGAFLIRNDRLTAASFPEKSKIGSVYIARVRDVVKNINACFVEIAEGEICFLSLQDAEYPLLVNRTADGRILEGDELLVEVIRDAQKTKQAAVSARISLSNDYFALAFGPPKTGFSAKLTGEQKKLLAERLTEEKILVDGALTSGATESIRESVGLPPLGLIVRTRAAEALEEERRMKLAESFQALIHDLELLLRNAFHRTCFSCLRESDHPMSGALDTMTFPDEYGEIVTDDEDTYAWLLSYTEEHMPEKPVRLYRDPLVSLSSLYSLGSRLSAALGEHVWLKSGGYLIIQPTEALTVIDVNSGKYEARNNAKDEAAFRVNREAAEEIALQLRLRNLSGIIIVDFINMESQTYRRKLIDLMDMLVRRDRVKTSVIDMTPLGLIEITRKKIMKPLREQLEVCAADGGMSGSEKREVILSDCRRVRL